MSAEQTEAVFAALADTTRRQLLVQLAAEGPLNATQLAASYAVTRQAVVKHLGALSDAGIVHTSRVGREVRYSVTTDPLADAASWLTSVGAQWDTRLDKLEQHFERRSGG